MLRIVLNRRDLSGQDHQIHASLTRKKKEERKSRSIPNLLCKKIVCGRSNTRNPPTSSELVRG
jgi:hypothetical protein